MSCRSILPALSGALLAAGLALPAAAQFTAAGPDLKPLVKTPFNGLVKVRNVGSATAGPSTLTIECQKIGGGACPEAPGMAAYEDPAYPNKAAVKVPQLKTGKTFTHKLSFWNALSFGPGVYRFTVIADDGNKVAEINEGNNVAVTKVTGGRGAGKSGRFRRR